MRDELAAKAKELNDIKQNLSIAVQQVSNTNPGNHFANLLEN